LKKSILPKPVDIRNKINSLLDSRDKFERLYLAWYFEIDFNMASKTLVNPIMLRWARQRSGISLSEFARKCGKTESVLHSWESGEKPLTFVQAQKFASVAHVPFGYLFLHQPPEETLPIPDLRTIGDREVGQPSCELLDLIKLTLQRQEWYKEYLIGELCDPCSVVGCVSIDWGVDDIVNSMRQHLKIPAFPTRGNSDEYYRELVKRIESLGILVMRESCFEHHTRPFNVEEFRGFAIADKYAPVVFVNHADAPGPRVFTLIHELCHIWMGVSGVSDNSEDSHQDTEQKCNAVAAQFLVPKKEFFNLWNREIKWENNLPVLEAHFRVSKWVVARRALTFELVTKQEYWKYVSSQAELWRNREKKGAPSWYTTKNAQVSSNFSKAVISQAFNGHLMLRDAGQLLGVKPSNIRKFASEVGF
jgi:Zn-dependent peptidase ImmA (M78 family)/transcriptional regulator with XRE-family HTH domain